MQGALQRAAALLRQQDLGDASSRFSWEGVRYFVACAEAGSFRRAGDGLRVDAATVARHIERLEHSLGLLLFHRLPNGIALTDEGADLLEHARQMERAAFDFSRGALQPENEAAGRVRVSIMEGLGVYWVMPRLVEFQRQHPRLTIDLQCALEPADILRMETDLSVQYARPEAPEVTVTRLGRLHIYLFASKTYIDHYGLPETAADITQHRFVDQVVPQVGIGPWQRAFGLDSLDGIIGVRTNSGAAYLYAVERGAGIGWLPTYAVAFGANVVPVDIGVSDHVDIWLAYHPKLKDVPRIRIVINWLKRIFDSTRYPWFGDEFIHPSELAALAPEAAAAHSIRDHMAGRAPTKRR